MDSPLWPDLTDRQKIGERYVRFLAAVPVDDAEMRRYDQDPAQVVRQVAASSDAARYPR